MSGAIHGYAWDLSPAGPMHAWPEPLRHAMRLTLRSAVPMAVLVGREGVLLFNDAALRLFGPRWENALGQAIGTALPEAAALCRDAVNRCFGGESLSYLDEPLTFERDGGRCVSWFDLAFTPVASEAGEVFGVLLFIDETTSRVEALREMRRANDRMEIALDAGGVIGTWDFDVWTNRIISDSRFARLFALDPRIAQTGVDNEARMERIHPDDRALVRACLARSIRDGVDYRCRYRVISPDGGTHWCHDAGRPVHDKDGVIVKLCGIVTDLTSQIAAEEALADSARRFEALVEAIPQIVWSSDARGRHDYFNSRWNEFTGLDAARVDGATWEHLVHPDDWPRVRKCWAESIITGKPYDIEYRFLHHSGQYRWLRVMALPVRGPDGEIMRWYGTSTDIEEGKVLEMERELIANELEHRIRNLFALVNSLVTLSAREDAAFAPFADQLQHRLSALHKAHEFIRARDPALDGAGSVQALARAILAPYDDGGRIVVQGDDVALQDHLVTPLALVFHELATNSVKYGALACDGGSLSVRFRCGNGRISLLWMEAGRQATDGEADCGGFGSKLLMLTIERQLKGTLSRTFSPTGLSFAMDIPA